MLWFALLHCCYTVWLLHSVAGRGIVASCLYLFPHVSASRWCFAARISVVQQLQWLLCVALHAAARLHVVANGVGF